MRVKASREERGEVNVNDPVPLDTWLEDAHQRLGAFAAQWRTENAKDAEMWPSEMNPGEWDEQFRAFDEGLEI